MLKNKGKSYIMNGVNRRKQGNDMKSSLRKIYKLITGTLIFAGMLGIVSCGNKVEGMSESLLTIEKDGTVRAEIVENFMEGYYDKDELQQTILEQAATYNRNAGSGSITVEKVESKDEMIIVQMTYAGTDDYASFNNAVFFAGTAMEAKEAGYDLNVVLSGVKDTQETVGESDILGMDNGRVLITNINDGIALDGKALYVSDNVITAPNAKSIWYTGGEDGLAYIVYQ